MPAGRSAAAASSLGAVQRLATVTVALAVILVVAPVADAAVTTAGAAAHSLPEREEEEVLPNFVVRPFDDALFQWEFRYDASARVEYLVCQFNFTTDTWYAVGFHADKRMNGPIGACWITSDRTQVTCDDYVGSNYDRPSVRTSEKLTQATLAGVSSTGNFLRFETIVGTNIGPPANGSTTPDYTNANLTLLGNGFTRVIFAKGEWEDAARASWKQHHTDNSLAVSIDWRTGEKEAFNSNLHRIVFYEMAAIAVGVILVSFLERHPLGPRDPIRRRIFAVLCVALYLSLLFQYTLFRYLDHTKNIAGKAQIRCFGDGAVFLLGTMALPVSKKLLLSTFFTCSHERAIKYHTFVGVLLVIFTLIHGIGMAYFYGVDGVTRWRNKDSQSRMPGLLAFLAIVFVVVPAFLRHFFWRTFRLLHYTYVIVFFLVVLHYPYAGVALAPGALLHLAAFASRRFVASHLAHENLDRVAYDEQSGVLSMDFVRSDCIPAGSWFTVCFPEISQLEHHPFSACRLLLVNGAQTTIVRLLARVNKDDPSSWTNRVARRVVESNATNADDLAVFTAFRLHGPYGVLEVNPKCYRHVLLIAGGMGITPHLLMLQQILINDTHTVGPSAMRLTVSLIWCVREPTLLEVFVHDLHALKTKLAQAYPKILVDMRIFCTVPGDSVGVAQLAPNPYVRTMNITCHKRPDFRAELTSLAAMWKPHVETAAAREAAKKNTMALADPAGAATTKPRSEADINVANYSVATYVSGPESFTEDATAALKAASKSGGDFVYHVHAEHFRL